MRAIGSGAGQLPRCLRQNGRGVALGRKSFLFVGHEAAGENLAGLYALVATCEANPVNPEAYLADVLLRVQPPSHASASCCRVSGSFCAPPTPPERRPSRSEQVNSLVKSTPVSCAQPSTGLPLHVVVGRLSSTPSEPPRTRPPRPLTPTLATTAPVHPQAVRHVVRRTDTP
jgi:hypothetical protein